MKPKKTTRKSVRRTKAKGDETNKRFESDLLVRGEAAELDSEGKLPKEATHAIIKSPDGDTVKRARFKYF
jgi:hypothetical protein